MSQLLENIADPISDSQPSGEDIARLEPSAQNEEWIQKYAELRGLVNRISSNSEVIVSISSDILSGKSKDLRIAGHLCLGLLYQNGFAGLSEGIKAYHILLRDYWDKGLYPSRDSARLNNLKTLDGRLSSDITAKSRADEKEFFVPSSASDRQAFEEIIQTIADIKSDMEDRTSNNTTLLDNFNRAINTRLKALGPDTTKPKPPPKAEDPTDKKKTSIFRKVVPSSWKPDEEEAKAETGIEFKNEMEAIRAVIQAARYLLNKNPRSVVPYRIVRSSLWYSLPLPNPNPDRQGIKMTPIPFPSGKSRLEELMSNEDWESMPVECESVFVENFEAGGGGCFCLDIQRFLSTALKELMTNSDAKLKGDYETLNKFIIQETALFVERFPWITEIVYSNGTPFVDNQTKVWLEKSVKPIFDSDSNQQNSPNTKESAEKLSGIDEDIAKAEDLLSRQKWQDALIMMQSGINTEPNPRGKFRRRLSLSEICLDAGQPEMARPLLEQLDEEIQHFSLDQWEPDLCLQVWIGLRRCYRDMISQKSRQTNEVAYEEKIDNLFEKICRLDIRAVLDSK
ncbi:hypothetical protein GF312_15735 [Candidatus Poribacteria bacterium]|nr:hypothetical protein [Candidatus Poribacteria bacterium]